MRVFDKAMLAKKRTLAIRIGTYTSKDINEASFSYAFTSGDTYKPGGMCSASGQVTFSSVITTFEKMAVIYPEIGLEVQGQMEWTKMGVFYIDDVEIDRNSNTTTLKLIDGMFKFNQPFVSDLSYPATVNDVIREMCTKLDVEMVNPRIGIETLRYEIPMKPNKDKITFRDVLGAATQLVGMSAFFNRDGKLEVRGLEDSDITITSDSYYLHGLKKSEIEYQIAGISCKVDKEVLTSGIRTGRSLEIENSFMTQHYLDNLYFALKEIHYYPYSLEYQGHLRLEIGQWVTVMTNKGETFKLPVLSQSFSFKGGLSGKISADTRAGNDAQYSYTGSLSKKIEQVSMDIEARVQEQMEAADNEFEEKFNKIKEDGERKAKEFQDELREQIAAQWEAGKVEWMDDAYHRILDELGKPDSDVTRTIEANVGINDAKLAEALDGKLKDLDTRIEKVTLEPIDDLRKKLDETAATSRVNAELIGGDGATTYNKNRLEGETDRTIPFKTDYIEVTHNGDGFVVGQPYVISWEAVCVPYGHRDVAITFQAPFWLGGGRLALVPKDSAFPTLRQDVSKRQVTVPMVYYGAYDVHYTSNWYQDVSMVTTISEGTASVTVPLTFKSVADANPVDSVSTTWATSPDIILDGGGRT